MASWALVLVGLAVAAYAAIAGVVSFEVTLALIVLGLVAAVIGGWMAIRGRRPA